MLHTLLPPSQVGIATVMCWVDRCYIEPDNQIAKLSCMVINRKDQTGESCVICLSHNDALGIRISICLDYELWPIGRQTFVEFIQILLESQK